jgi:hypothetical protein
MQAVSPTRSQDRVPFGHMLIYGAGAFVNNLLAGAFVLQLDFLCLGKLDLAACRNCLLHACP